ncbi:MAG: 4Fe-4S dicluster domain-containing protein [Candidatus Helarchaeota archaeon]
MVESNFYEIVRQKLDIGDIKHPKHEKIYELMKIFWNEEDIELLSHFPSAGEVISLKALIEKSGMPKDQVKRILKKVVKKKTIAKIGRNYGLEPLLPGVFEAYFIARQDSEENLKKAAKIYRYIFENAAEVGMNKEGFLLFSPLLPYEAEVKLIEINKPIESKSKVLSYELVEELIKKNDFFAVIPCQCRLIAELNGEKCEVAPAEMGCFLVGPSVLAVVNMGFGKALTKEEAIEYLKKTEKAGLVHNADYDSSDHTFICNCCSCHCGILLPLKKFKIPYLKPTNFSPEINQELCVLCKTCLNICPMGAISFQEAEEKMIINLGLCIGCGVCATNCAKNAISMNKIRNVIPPKENKIGNKSFGEILEDLLV